MTTVSDLAPMLARLQCIEDRESIKELTARYAWLVARGDGEAMAYLFTPDGVFESPSGTLKGREQLADFYTKHIYPPQTVPLGMNHIITLDGDSALATLAMLSPWRGKDIGLNCGFYNDCYTKVDGRWYFAHRKWTYYERPV